MRIRFTVNYHKDMQKEIALMLQNVRNPVLGFLVFGITIVFLLLIAAPIQQWLGLWGVAITEIGILLIAVLATILSKQRFSVVFPFKRVTWRDFGGCTLVYLGAFFASIAISLLLLYFFPDMAEVSDAINTVITSQGLLPGILIVAILPGICEEVLNRGFILSSFSGIKSTFARVLIVGVLFGIFHLNVYRFFPTMLLGMGLTYMMVRTGNLLLPMFFHFINNLLPLLSVMAIDGVDPGVAAGDLNGAVLGIVPVYLILSCLCWYFGIKTLRPRPAAAAAADEKAVAEEDDGEE